MLGKTHLLAGALSGIAVASLTHNETPLVLAASMAMGSLGGLLPDLDHPNALISRRVGIAAAPIHMFFTHRGFLHSGVLLALVCVLAYLFPVHDFQFLFIALAVGWGSHLLLDAMTKSGIPLFFPFKHRFTLLPLSTGGLIESVFRLGLLGVLVYSVVIRMIR